MPSVGIDISDRSIKYVELLSSTKGNLVGRHGSLSIPQGVVEGGKIINKEALKEMLVDLRVKENITFVRAALPEEQVYFFHMNLPKESKGDLREMIELSLEEHVPVVANDILFDFEVLNDIGDTVEVAVTAAPHSIIDSYAEVFEEAGLTLLSLELEGEAITRAVLKDHDEEASMIIDFGETRTGITIAYGGHVHFSSTVAIGGQMLSELLAKHLNISLVDAEKYKREYGLKRNTGEQDLFSLLLNNVAVLRDEVNRHLMYWQAHSETDRPHPIKKIILVGGDSNLAGFAEYLSASLRIPARMADVWQNTKLHGHYVPPVSFVDSLGYATSIGLALHHISYE